MLAKATCVTLHTLFTILSIRPPASSTTKEKADKVKDEGLFSYFMIKLMPRFGESAAIIATALHILLMSRGVISGELKTWQVLATFSGLLGYLLRSWSFRTLDRFFTVSLLFFIVGEEKEHRSRNRSSDYTLPAEILMSTRRIERTEGRQKIVKEGVGIVKTEVNKEE